MTTINRRRLLAGTALAAGTTWLAGASWMAGRPTREAPSRQVAFGGRIYRGTDDGRILRSSDDGATWEVNDDFGSGYRVTELGLGESGLFAQLRFRDRSFRVRSQDAARWYA